MFKTRRRKIIAACLGVLAVAVAAGWWVTRTWTVTGEIRDTAIVLSPDHAGTVVNFELRNVGSEACDLIVVLTSLAVDALPVDSGRVVTYDGGAVQMGPDGSLPTGVPIVGYVGPGNKVTATLGQSVQPGDVARLQVAFFGGTPRADNLVILCNGAGQYAAGRRAMLAFDR
jgi:hypothetical protein